MRFYLLLSAISVSVLWCTENFAWSEDLFNDNLPAAPVEKPLEKNETKVFAGVDMGASNLYSVPGNEQRKSGYLFDIKALASLYYPKWDIDLGLGYFSDNMNTNVKSLRIVTNGLLIDAEPQYRVTPSLQVGPVLNILAGSDVSFSESEAGASSDTFNVLAGIGVKYALPISNYTVRLVGQITDTVGADRSVWVIQGGVQFGFSVMNR